MCALLWIDYLSKQVGIACLRIYNLDIFLNRKMLGDPIPLELKKKTLNMYSTLLERRKEIFINRRYLTGTHFAPISAGKYIVIAYTGDPSFALKRN